MATMHRKLSAVLLVPFALAAALWADDPPAYEVEIKDGTAVAQEILLPIDPQVRITAQHSNSIYFGLQVDGKRITCSPQGSVWPAALVDGTFHNPASGNNPVQMQVLTKGANGKVRQGFLAKWKIGQLEFAQIVEVVPSKPAVAAANAKRRLDTCRISYLVENKDKVQHEVAMRSSVDILINNNDGALYASPTTEPGKILNGVALEGKTLPAFVQVLERPDLRDPGMVAVMTLKFGGKIEGPNNLVLTQLGAVGGAGWDVPALPAGDSACALFWEKKMLQPGQKREMVWAYGGGLATNPDNDGKVTVALGGNFEPGKVFTVSALVEDPTMSQTLAIEMPPGMDRIDGAEIQPVPDPSGGGYSLVLWKGRVNRPGAFDIRVRSSTGVTQTKSIVVRPTTIGGR